MPEKKNVTKRDARKERHAVMSQMSFLVRLELIWLIYIHAENVKNAYKMRFCQKATGGEISERRLNNHVHVTDQGCT